MDYGLLKKYTREINLLFIEDDVNFRKEFTELLQDIFPFVSISVDGEDGLKMYNEFFLKNGKYYDLIISDIRMPNLDGIQLIKEIYNINSKQIVVMLSARNEFNYLLPLVNLGIEHFFTKPLNYNSFLNEILNISSKIYYFNKSTDKNIIRIKKNIIWDKNKIELSRDKTIIKLTKKEIIFFEQMINNRIYSGEELISLIWHDETDVSIGLNNLKNLISRVRKKVPEIIIKNIYGLGYKMI